MTPESVDIAPTVLWLMGGSAGPGIRHGMKHSATWLQWQDGKPLHGLLEEDECVPAFQYVFVFLFDGLASNELVHLWESGDPTIPAFSKILSDGTVFRNGAIVGFPTVSVPGHLTVGTGMYNGHHRFLANGFYRRDEGKVISPNEIFTNQQAYIDNPQLALDLFDDIFNPEGETLCEAVHRLLGDSAFCAAINELTLRGADYNLVTLAENMDLRTDYYELADMMAMPQLLGLIDEPRTRAVPGLHLLLQDGRCG
ncbi:MAG: alkaline phosphatase family protein [Deltaproteobacteria bacterium]|nr:alkaline phosphatase family protein [Deltaproteobacteria bacterium]